MCYWMIVPKCIMLKVTTTPFQQQVQAKLDSTGIIKDVNEVLLFKLKNNNIQAVLEFKPEEEHLFKKYFERLIDDNPQ